MDNAEGERNLWAVCDDNDVLLSRNVGGAPLGCWPFLPGHRADREDVRLRGQVQTQTDAIKFSVIDPPSAPRAPAAPNRPLLLTLVLLAAIGGGIAAAFALGHLKTTYPTASRLERASGLPVIGTISEVIRTGDHSFRKKRMRQFAGGAAALIGVWALLMMVEFVQRSMVT